MAFATAVQLHSVAKGASGFPGQVLAGMQGLHDCVSWCERTNNALRLACTRRHVARRCTDAVIFKHVEDCTSPQHIGLSAQPHQRVLQLQVYQRIASRITKGRHNSITHETLGGCSLEQFRRHTACFTCTAPANPHSSSMQSKGA